MEAERRMHRQVGVWPCRAEWEGWCGAGQGIAVSRAAAAIWAAADMWGVAVCRMYAWRSPSGREIVGCSPSAMVEHVLRATAMQAGSNGVGQPVVGSLCCRTVMRFARPEAAPRPPRSEGGTGERVLGAPWWLFVRAVPSGPFRPHFLCGSGFADSATPSRCTSEVHHDAVRR